MHNTLRGRGQVGLIICSCGKLHFTYGPLTLHFDRDEFLRFADEVNHSAAHLRDPEYRCDQSLPPHQTRTQCH